MATREKDKDKEKDKEKGKEKDTETAAKPRGALQDMYLFKAQKENRLLKVFLMNGVPIDGKVKGFDQFTIVMEEQKTGKEVLIYKHAISTIKD